MRSDAAEAARILVVDDIEPNRDLLARRLQRLGHHVTMAASGQEALDVLARERMDVVLLDIMMPGMSGYDVLERIKADAELRDLPVIMISAIDEVESIVRCIDLGADDYLPKPFNPVILRARLDASLARKRLRERERLYAQAMARELEIGRTIQRSFLPATLPEVPGYEIAGLLEPARQVSGDFYDAFTVGGGDRVVLVVGDVCDKGVGAALFMALFRSLIRSAIDPAFAGTGDRGEEAVLRVVRFLNEYITHSHGETNMFATLFLGELDPGTGRLAYVNCGHEPPIVLDHGRLRTRLEATGPAVGLMPDLPFTAAAITLEPGMTVITYTDGVPEARSASGETLGEAQLIATAESKYGSADDLQATIRDAVTDFVGEAPQADDVTILVLRRPD